MVLIILNVLGSCKIYSGLYSSLLRNLEMKKNFILGVDYYYKITLNLCGLLLPNFLLFHQN